MSSWPPELRASSVKSNWIRVVGPPAQVSDNQSNTFAAVMVTGFVRAIQFDHASNQPPIEWLTQKQCADGALVVRSDGKITAHVFEHKGSMTPKEWFKAKLQTEGMCDNLRAALAVVGVDQPSEFILHVSFTQDRMDLDDANPADLILKKALTGSSRRLLDIADWQANEAAIPNVGRIELRRILRDQESGLGECAL